MIQSPKELDVRPILKDGGEPFQAIMAAVDSLAPGQGLKLFATFRPVPLFQVMARKGFDHEAEEIGNGEWQVLFTPKPQAGGPIETSGNVNRLDDWPEPEHHLDLTDLDPPEPMTRILGAVETMRPGEVLFALLAREPVFLFPELERRGHQWAGNFDEAGTAFRILIRAGAAKENGNG